MITEAREAAARGTMIEPTLVYAQTTREVDEIAAALTAQGVAAVK